MRKAERMVRYVFLMIGVLGSLFVVNLVLYCVPAMSQKTQYHYKTNMGRLEEALYKKNGRYDLEKQEKEYLKRQGEFAMLIDEEGEVIWSFQLPEEIPRSYDLKDVASFSRWYLKNYPVFTRITEEGLLVKGMPKNSVWKYLLVEDMNELTVRLSKAPIVLAIDALVLILLPFYILRRRMKKEDYERTEWIAGISHDIRTPLSLVLGNADCICHGEVSKEIKENADNIKKQTLYIKDLIANLNTENKLSYGAGQWKKDRVILADVIRDVFCDILNQNEEGLYEVSCEIDETLEKAWINADENLFRRMLENLFGNAIRHNPDGCGICVKLLPIEKCFIKKRYRFIIEDNGKGADEKKWRRFNRKFRKTKIAEHGLGLRVVNQIAKLYHWKITFFSEKGKGFRCEIELK